MPLITSIVNWLNFKRVTQIDLIRKYPDQIQKECFIQLINKAVDTEWGKIHEYNTIESIEEFQEKTPLNTYEDLKPFNFFRP